MKKILSKTLFAAFSISMLFSSCLGDNDGTYESSNTLAYINKTSEGINYAVANNGYLAFTSKTVQDALNYGRVYRLGYAISTKDGYLQTSDKNASIAIAKSVSLQGEGYALTNASPISVVPTTPNIENEIPISKLGVGLYSPWESTMNDAWVVQFTCTVYEEDLALNHGVLGGSNVTIEAYIEEDNQVKAIQGGTEPLKENQVIVNLYVKRISPISDMSKEKEKPFQGEYVINMSELRRYLESRIGSSDKTDIIAPIQLEFRVADGEGGFKDDPERLGSLDENPSFGMLWAE